LEEEKEVEEVKQERGGVGGRVGGGGGAGGRVDGGGYRCKHCGKTFTHAPAYVQHERSCCNTAATRAACAQHARAHASSDAPEQRAAATCATHECSGPAATHVRSHAPSAALEQRAKTQAGEGLGRQRGEQRDGGRGAAGATGVGSGGSGKGVEGARGAGVVYRCK
jgi:hypothetical protein